MAVDELVYVLKTITSEFMYGTSDSRRLYVATAGVSLMAAICLLSFYYAEFTLAFLIVAIWVFF